MSRFQGTILPSGLEDKRTETETRKMGLDLLKKINTLDDDLSSDITDVLTAVNLLPINDDRVTTGGTRTETAISIAIGKTSILNWQLKNTSGGAATFTLALPATGTYSVSLLFDSTGGANDTLAVSANVSMARSKGTVVGGSTVTLIAGLANGNGTSVTGTITRIT